MDQVRDQKEHRRELAGADRPPGGHGTPQRPGENHPPPALL